MVEEVGGRVAGNPLNILLLVVVMVPSQAPFIFVLDPEKFWFLPLITLLCLKHHCPSPRFGSYLLPLQLQSCITL